jgi:hypothetical protein
MPCSSTLSTKACALIAAKAGIEALRQHRLHAAFLEQPRFGGQQGEPERPGVRHEVAPRMRLEGERDQRGIERARLLLGARHQYLMAAMHAVEVAERDHAAGPLRRGRLPVVEDRDHPAASRRGTRTTASPSITTLSPFRHWVLSVTRRPLLVDCGDGGRGSDGLADQDGRHEVHRLGNIDRARARQLGADHRRDEAAAQHAVRDALAETRGARKAVVQMDRVGVTRDAGESHDVGLCDRLAEHRRHADLEVVEIKAGHGREWRWQ